MGGAREKYLSANPDAMRSRSRVIISTVKVVGNRSAHVKLNVMIVISNLSARGSIAIPKVDACVVIMNYTYLSL